MTLSLVEVTNARFGSGASEKLGYQVVQPSDHVSSEHMLWVFIIFLHIFIYIIYHSWEVVKNFRTIQLYDDYDWHSGWILEVYHQILLTKSTCLQLLML